MQQQDEERMEGACVRAWEWSRRREEDGALYLSRAQALDYTHTHAFTALALG